MADTVTIMRAKDYDEKHREFPCLLSEKLDGVPAKFFWKGDKVVAVTRQGTELTSVGHIITYFEQARWFRPGLAVVGELYIPGQPFEYISGQVRTLDKTNTDLHLFMYDAFYCDEKGNPDDRRDFAQRLLSIPPEFHKDYRADCGRIHMVFQHTSYTEREFDEVRKAILIGFCHIASKPEGVMVRAMHGDVSKYTLSRSWGMMRIVPKPAIDLLVVDVVQAKDKNGQPKVSAGSLLCKYKDTDIKVGAGKATNDLRREWWQNPGSIVGKIVQVQYKPSTYNKLRQPTFQRIRDDKWAPDA